MSHCSKFVVVSRAQPQQSAPTHDTANSSGAQAIQQAQQKVVDAAQASDQSTLDDKTANDVKNIDRIISTKSSKDSEVGWDILEEITEDLAQPSSVDPPGFVDNALSALKATVDTPSNSGAPLGDEANSYAPEQQQQALQSWQQYCTAQQNLNQAIQQYQSANLFFNRSAATISSPPPQPTDGPQLVAAPQPPAPAQWNPPCPEPYQDSNQFFNYFNSQLSNMASPYRPTSTPSTVQSSAGHTPPPVSKPSTSGVHCGNSVCTAP